MSNVTGMSEMIDYLDKHLDLEVCTRVIAEHLGYRFPNPVGNIVISRGSSDPLDPARPGYIYFGSDYVGQLVNENDGDWRIKVDRNKDDVHYVNLDFFPPKEYVVAGTGPRSLQIASSEVKKEAFEAIVGHLKGLKEIHGEKLVVISGMAEGFDTALATAAISLGIRLWAFIPNKNYGTYYWGRKSVTGKNQVKKFNDLVEKTELVDYTNEHLGVPDKALYVNPQTGEWNYKWFRGSMHMNLARNLAMIEVADHFLVGTSDPQSKGTKSCFNAIKKAKVPYTLI